MMVSNLNSPPWEKSKMTVCIAAACQLNGEPHIVLCSDWQEGSVLGTAEVSFKQISIGQGWTVMAAGDSTEINALRNLYGNHILGATSIDKTNVVSVMQAPLHDRKRQKIEQLIQGRVGISYDDFLQFGRERLSETVFLGVSDDIDRMTLGADVIMAGFIDEFPWILSGRANGTIEIHENFTSIGEGSYLAQSSLMQRNCVDIMELPEMTYLVYEAKRNAESVASVGRSTTLQVQGANGLRKYMNSKGMEHLSDHYDKLGPQKINVSFSFPDETWA